MRIYPERRDVLMFKGSGEKTEGGVSHC